MGKNLRLCWKDRFRLDPGPLCGRAGRAGAGRGREGAGRARQGAGRRGGGEWCRALALGSGGDTGRDGARTALSRADMEHGRDGAEGDRGDNLWGVGGGPLPGPSGKRRWAGAGAIWAVSMPSLSRQSSMVSTENPGTWCLRRAVHWASRCSMRLRVAARGERLPMSVLLVAQSAGCRAGGAAGVLGIALQGVSGNCRRARPTELALIFLLLHLAQASWERRRRRVPGDVAGASSWLSWALRLRFGWGWELSCVGGGSMRRDGADTDW
jgi:hypothetical protein